MKAQLLLGKANKFIVLMKKNSPCILGKWLLSNVILKGGKLIGVQEKG